MDCLGNIQYRLQCVRMILIDSKCKMRRLRQCRVRMRKLFFLPFYTKSIRYVLICAWHAIEPDSRVFARVQHIRMQCSARTHLYLISSVWLHLAAYATRNNRKTGENRAVEPKFTFYEYDNNDFNFSQLARSAATAPETVQIDVEFGVGS